MKSICWSRPLLLGIVACGALVMSPTAHAAPACTAAGLASTVSSVTAAAGQYLDGHPEANDALTQAGSQAPEEAKASLRSYFMGHSDQYFALQNIARPLSDLRAQCNSDVGLTQIAALLQALSE